jgi:hypothetical protein
MYTKHKERFRDTEHVQINNYTFQSVNKFKYLGVLVSENSKIKSEIKTRMTAGNRCYHAFITLSKSAVVSRKTKLIIYQTVIRPAVMYGLEVWTLSKSDENSLGIWERETLRRIFGTVKENVVRRIHTNQEFMNL